MKSILMSIQPKWVAKILNGEKTIEVRKTAPKEVPFKVYIYCTGVKNLNLTEYVKLHSETGGAIDYWHGKVIGEFVCDSISNFDLDGLEFFQMKDHLLRLSNLTEVELKSYIGKGIGKALHITNLKVYDKPKELGEFYRLDDSGDDCCCGCIYHEIPMNEYPCCKCNGDRKYLTHAPQSYMRIQDTEEM